MKKLLLLLTITSLLFITSCELFTEEPVKGDVYYINVGIDYKNNSDSDDNLNGTINDAKELNKIFSSIITRTGRNGNGYLMLQEGAGVSADHHYPSKTNIENMLISLADATQEEDLVIFTYSGHGEKNTGALLLATPTAGDSPNPSDLMDTEELLLLMTDIPGKKLIILDSCFSGMFVEQSPSSTNTILNNSIAKFFETYHSSDLYGKPDLFVLTASAHTDSYEPKDAPHVHGFFTSALLEALGWNHPHGTTINSITPGYPPAAKNDQITVDGLFKYIKKNQDINSRFILFSSPSEFQHPMTTGGPLDFVLFNL